jgi:hypothetical protein
VIVRAHLKATGRHEELLEQIVTRLSLEPGVTAMRWEIVWEAAGVADATSALTSNDRRGNLPLAWRRQGWCPQCGPLVSCPLAVAVVYPRLLG